jgi:aerobic-type carbon monoxide dehydrogenase small subunit (CoxS/CutS family)
MMDALDNPGRRIELSNSAPKLFRVSVAKATVIPQGKVGIVTAADGAPLHPMQEAFREHHALQCGFCTPGMIMAALDIVRRRGNDLDEHTIREQLDGNICRCTGYHNIVKAIAAGAKAMAKGGARQAAE